MITVVSGTNRKNSNSIKIANFYAEVLKSKGEEVQILTLTELPSNLIDGEMYGERSDSYAQLIDEKVANAEKFVFIVPEYNGGFPGILKTFVDSVSPSHFYHKKAALVGVSAGHTGCLLGMDHFTGVLHYLKVEVLSRKPKISFIDDKLSTDGTFEDEACKQQLREQAEMIVRF